MITGASIAIISMRHHRIIKFPIRTSFSEERFTRSPVSGKVIDAKSN
jgi:hypothetical protein